MTESGSRFWHGFFRVAYRFIRLIDPLIRLTLALGLPGLNGVVEVRVPGRRSGRSRRLLVTLLTVGDRRYIGHPNGDAAWTRNVEAAGIVAMGRPGVAGASFTPIRLPPGDERDSVIRATRDQQPFPANLAYRAAGRHITAAGVYFRLVPVSRDAPDSA
jgi:hypothetical protein